MATDGTPEPAAKRCGEAIARLRTMRRWSRAHLVIRLYDELSPDDPSYDSISETWLARLENGRMVKVPRQTVEALCRALRCTPRERARVLLHADRCALTDAEAAPTAPAEVLAYVMDRLYNETYDLLAGMLGAREPEALDETELLDMASAALESLIARRDRQRAQAVANGHHARNGHAAHAPRPAHAARDGRIGLVPRIVAGAGAQ